MKRILSFFILISLCSCSGYSPIFSSKQTNFYIDKIMLNIFKLIPSRIELNLVHTPEELAYNNLSEKVGKIVEKNNPVFFKKNNIEWIGSLNSSKLMLEYLKKQDKFSKLKLEEYLPEFFAIIKE